MNKTSKRIIVKARLSYPQLFTPRAFDDKSPAKYSSVLVVEDPSFIKLVATTLKEVATEAFGDKAAQVIAKVKKNQIKDADEVAAKGYPEGSLVFTAKNEERPGLVARTADPSTGKAMVITEEMATTAGGPYEMYGGVVCNVALSVYSYNHPKGGPGVGFGLDGLQRWEEGERFGAGRTKVEDMFDFEAPVDVDLNDVLGGDEDEDDPIADIL